MNWPSTLPQRPLLRNFREQQRENRREFDPDGGRSTAIRFYTNVPDVLTVNFFLDLDQKQVFKQFYNDVGTDTFAIPDPETGTTVTARFVGGPPEYTTVGGRFTIAQFEIEIL